MQAPVVMGVLDCLEWGNVAAQRKWLHLDHRRLTPDDWVVVAVSVLVIELGVQLTAGLFSQVVLLGDC